MPENLFPFLPHGASLLTTILYIAAHCSMKMLRKPMSLCFPARQSYPTAVVSSTFQLLPSSSLPLWGRAHPEWWDFLLDLDSSRMQAKSVNWKQKEI